MRERIVYAREHNNRSWLVKIPTEILILILESCFELYLNDSYKINGQFLPAALTICSHIRLVVIKTPLLWTHIIWPNSTLSVGDMSELFNMTLYGGPDNYQLELDRGGEHVRRGVDRVMRRLERSQPLPISLFVHHDHAFDHLREPVRDMIKSLASQLQPHLCRVQRIKYTNRRFYTSSYFGRSSPIPPFPLSCPMPKLTSLIVDVYPSVSEDPEYWFQSGFWAPKLEKYQGPVQSLLRGFDYHTEAPVVPVALPTALHSIGVNIPSPPYGTQGTGGASLMQILLIPSPSSPSPPSHTLVNLSLHFRSEIRPFDEAPPQLISLPFPVLECLALRVASRSGELPKISRRLDAPRLLHLEFAEAEFSPHNCREGLISADTPTFMQTTALDDGSLDINHEGPTFPRLLSLHLRGIKLPPRDLGEFLRRHHSVSSLELTLETGTSFVWMNAFKDHLVTPLSTPVPVSLKVSPGCPPSIEYLSHALPTTLPLPNLHQIGIHFGYRTLLDSSEQIRELVKALVTTCFKRRAQNSAHSSSGLHARSEVPEDGMFHVYWKGFTDIYIWNEDGKPRFGLDASSLDDEGDVDWTSTLRRNVDEDNGDQMDENIPQHGGEEHGHNILSGDSTLDKVVPDRVWVMKESLKKRGLWHAEELPRTEERFGW